MVLDFVLTSDLWRTRLVKEVEEKELTTTNLVGRIPDSSNSGMRAISLLILLSFHIHAYGDMNGFGKTITSKRLTR
jgi:hypothetical protein